MSFALTEPQFLDGSKDVTRRLGWEDLPPGEQLTAIRKGMGLAKGEKQVELGPILVVSARRERLDAIDQDDCRREGFPELTPAQFVAFFCKANGCKPETIVTRIEFRRVTCAAQEAA
jgi:hypothetical protein